jgi:four helix bundle protein
MKVEELDVFKLTHELTLEIYKITESFPKNERYGLTSQMRRAAMSIGSNLMEGSHRFSKKEYKYFTGISRGSTGELKYQLLLSKDLSYINTDTFEKIKNHCERVSMMLSKLYSALDK